MEDNIRKTAIAGSWYPGTPEVLTRDIRKYLDNASISPSVKKPAVIICPHAGYMYSGPVAGYAYKAVSGHRYKNVVVISPSHKAFFPFVSVWAMGGFETPLGRIDIDTELCSSLMNSSRYIRDERSPHVTEHALEIQLPFLKHVLGEFSLCPLIMGEQSLPMCRELSEALEKAIPDPEETLVVASSDLSHFHHAERAHVMDKNLAKLISGYDIEGLSDAIDSGRSEACGGGPIMAAMLYAKAKGRTDVNVLKYATSADITGDRSSVVGYLSAVIS
ncbi:MAG TPA: AmmeMemoRadiSam system protein B [Desulfomonilia bacterium]|jgi:AmmeMemoRadiSam system protein B